MADFDLGAVSLETEVDLSGLDQGIADAEGRAQSGFSRIGDVMGDALKVGIMAAGAAVVAGVAGIGVAALDVAGQVNQSVNEFQAQLGVTKEEAEALGETALKVWGNNWGASLEDVQNSLILVRQGMKGLSETELQQATQDAIALRDAFGEDMNESVAAANALMQQFGLNSSQSFDFLAAASQRGINITGELNDLINENAAALSASGVTAEQFFSILDESFKKGINDPEVLIQALTDANFRAQQGITGTSVTLAQLEGATDAISAKYNNWPSMWEGVKRSALVAIEPIGQKLLELANAVMPLVQAGFAWLQNDLPPIIENVVTVIDAVAAAISAILSGPLASSLASSQSDFDSTWKTVTDILSTAAELIGIVIGGIAAAFREHGDAIATIAGGAWTIVKNVIMGALDIIKGVLQTALALMKGDWQGAWTAIQEMSAAVVTRLGSIIKGGLDIIAGFFGTSLDKIIETWRGNWDMLVDIAQKLPSRLVDVGGAIVRAIADGFARAWENFIAAAAAKLQAFRDMLPFSEPKDHRSPLYGLSKSGESIVNNIGEGIMGAGPLSVPQLSLPSLALGGAGMLGGGTAIGGHTFIMDLRGSSLTEGQVKKIVQEAFDEAGREADARRRTWH